MSRLHRLVVREPLIMSELVRQFAMALMLAVILIRPDSGMRLFAAVLLLALSGLLTWTLRIFLSEIGGWPGRTSAGSDDGEPNSRLR